MPDNPLLRYGLLAAAGFAAGIFNAIAGGGSFFSFPALLGFGLPPISANATNAVALWPGHLTSMIALRREMRQVRHALASVVFCSAVGGILGAVGLLLTNPAVFIRLVPWLMLVATTLFVLGDPARKWLERRRAAKPRSPARRSFSAATLAALVVVCAYIGYFGAGAAFLIYAVFAVFNGSSTIYEVLAIKTLCNAVANAVAIATFILAGAVYWRECMVMVALASLGGYLGSMYARRFSPKVLRAIVMVTGFAFSLYYFWKVYR